MKIIAGLGNPGAQYANTPHSVGFEAVDAIAAKMGAEWEPKKAFNALIAKGSFGGSQVTLVKPQTFMNLSGEAVAPIVKYGNASAEDLVVIQDDIDLPAGRMRIRKGGSCGGHNGVRNIIERLGSQAFVRVRVGVGMGHHPVSDLAARVLGRIEPEDEAAVAAGERLAAEAALCAAEKGADFAMNKYNGPETVES